MPPGRGRQRPPGPALTCLVPQLLSVRRRQWPLFIIERSGFMWIRKCYVDDQSDIQSPIPNCISSNEEFYPPPQSARELEVENRLREMADKNAKKLGLSRRRFLQTTCGMATAMI